VQASSRSARIGRGAIQQRKHAPLSPGAGRLLSSCRCSRRDDRDATKMIVQQDLNGPALERRVTRAGMSQAKATHPRLVEAEAMSDLMTHGSLDLVAQTRRIGSVVPR